MNTQSGDLYNQFYQLLQETTARGCQFNTMLHAKGCEEGHAMYSLPLAKHVATLYGYLSFITIRCKFWVHVLGRCDASRGFSLSAAKAAGEEITMLREMMSEVGKFLEEGGKMHPKKVGKGAALPSNAEGGLWAHLHVMVEGSGSKRVSLPHGASLASMTPEVIGALQVLVKAGLLARKDDTPAAADKPLPTALGLQPQHDALPVGNDIRLPVARKQQGCGIEGCRLKRNIAPQETRG